MMHPIRVKSAKQFCVYRKRIKLRCLGPLKDLQNQITPPGAVKSGSELNGNRAYLQTTAYSKTTANAVDAIHVCMAAVSTQHHRNVLKSHSADQNSTE